MGYLSRLAFIIGAAASFAGCGGVLSPVEPAQPVLQGTQTSVGAESKNFKVIYAFGGSPDGRDPLASVTFYKGKLYGTTYAGGGSSVARCFNPRCGTIPPNFGTVFSLTTGGTETVLHSFINGGVYPESSLIAFKNSFYGTTSQGGSFCGSSYYDYGCGTVFKISPNGSYKDLHFFKQDGDGYASAASLLALNGTFYGTTEFGGAHNKGRGGCGTVFSITPSGTEKVLHSFGNGSDGCAPTAPLINVNGKLYGTTSEGGTYNFSNGGTVFSITLNGHERVLHSFGSEGDGASPYAALVDVAGTLYGTTSEGGYLHCKKTRICGNGTVFSITPKGREKVLHAFTGADGAGSVAALTEVQGTLFGTAQSGGSYDCGTAFSITPQGATKLLHNFNCMTDGASPAAGMIDVDGTLYGTAARGGLTSHGTIFALTP